MKIKYLFLSSLVMLTACSDDRFADNAPESAQYICTIPPFEIQGGGDTTRTIPQISGNEVHSFWTLDDEIGVFPFKERIQDSVSDSSPMLTIKEPVGDQVSFRLNSKESASVAAFNPGGWQTKPGISYSAYYPLVPRFDVDPHNIMVDFTGQKPSSSLQDLSYLGAYDHMVAVPNAPVSTTSGINFEFKHLAALGFADVDLLYRSHIFYKLKSFEFKFDEKLPFVEKARYDLALNHNDIKLQPLTFSKSFNIDLSQVDPDRVKQPTIAFMMCPTKVKGKSCKAVLTYYDNHNVERQVYSDLTFVDDILPGKAYRFIVNLPYIDFPSHNLHLDEKGSMTPSYISQAMNGSDTLYCSGYLNAQDMYVLRYAAGYSDKTINSTGKNVSDAAQPIIKNLDLRFTEIVEPNDYGVIKSDYFSNTSLKELSLPQFTTHIEANAFKGLSLTKLSILGVFPIGKGNIEHSHKLTIDPHAFDNFITAGCDLHISENQIPALSVGENNDVLFNGCIFKSLKIFKTYDDDNISPEELHLIDVRSPFVSSNILGGLITPEHLSTIINILHVSGVINDKDIATIGSCKGNVLTSLAFLNMGNFVPSVAAFADFTNSENCDLEIPDSWKHLITQQQGGKLMFCGKVWKKISNVSTGLGFNDLPGYEPALQNKK